MVDTQTIICAIDNIEFDCREYLHAHLKKLKITQEEYYTKYHPRFDLLTGEQIKFKSVEQYLSSDFNDKRNMKKWLLTNGDQAKNWAIDWLKKRKNEKGLIFSPCQAELLSLMAPTMHYYERIGGYYNICQELGFINRYDNIGKIKFKNLDGIKVICDTRERKPLNFKSDIVVERKKLDVGDYALEESHRENVFIERKSLNDFIGTLSGDIIRFKNEIERARDNGQYIVMLIENTINDCMYFHHFKQTQFSKANPSYVFKVLRDLLHQYHNLQPLFVNGRVEAAHYALRILQMGKQVEKIDLQWALENKLI